MPDTEEVFRMSTQKVKQEPGALERQFKRRDRKNRNRKVGAIAVVGAIVVLALVVVMSLRDTSGETVVPASSAPSVPPGTQYLVDVETGERTPAPAELSGGRFYQVSPDGSMIAFYTCCSSDDRVWVANIDGTEKRAIAPANLDGYAPSWSPDGSTLVFQGRNADTQEVGQLYLADVESGKVTRLTNLDRLTPPSGLWIVRAGISPDGGSVMFHLPRGTSPSEKWDLWTIPITGGTPTLLRQNAGFASYGPDGTIAFLDHPRDLGDVTARAIWAMDADGSHVRKLVGGGPFIWPGPTMSPDGTRVAYEQSGSAYVADVTTGRATAVATGTHPAWVDDHTLIVG